MRVNAVESADLEMNMFSFHYALQLNTNLSIGGLCIIVVQRNVQKLFIKLINYTLKWPCGWVNILNLIYSLTLPVMLDDIE